MIQISLLSIFLALTLVAQPPLPRNLSGWADLHAHPMSHLGFGRKALHGAPDEGSIIPAGTRDCNPTEFRAASIQQALGHCNSTHGGWGTDNGCGDYIRAALINHALDGGFEHKVSTDRNLHGDHEHAGYPDFRFWPNHTSKLHQQMWVDWLRRAHSGGLRVMVALAVNSEILAEILNGDRPYDDRTVADVQIDETISFVQRHRDFMEVAYTPADLRRIVSSNRLAVVLGMEVDKLGNFGQPGVTTTPTAVRAEIRRLHGRGVRYLFPVHLIDNSFGGSAVYNMLFNFANKRANGRMFGVTPSADPNVAYRANLTDGPIGFENGLVLGLRGLLEGIGQLPAPCFNHIRCFPPPGKVSCCGSYQNIVNILTPSPELDAYKFIPGGHVNARGLSPLGEVAIDEMMRLGMLIDIDHMSERAMTRTLDLAQRFSPEGYPLNMGHNGIRKPGGNERGAPLALVRRIAALGGMFGVGTAQTTHGAFRDNFREVWRAMGGTSVAVGTDVNGFEELPRRQAGKGSAADSEAFYRDFFRSSPILSRSVTGTRTFDYVREGGATHYGLMPEFFHEVRLNGGGDVISNLNSSAEHFARTWEKAARLSSPAVVSMGATEISLAAVTSDIHNNDCKRFYGTVRLELWLTDTTGRRVAQIAPSTGGGTVLRWERGPAQTVTSFAPVVTNQLRINSIYSYDRALASRIQVVVTTNLGSAHKGCDLCTDFTWEASMPGPREQRFSLGSLLGQTSPVKTFVAGPYPARDGRHSIRVHFELR